MRVTILLLLGALIVVYLGVMSINRNEGGEDTGDAQAAAHAAAMHELTDEEYAAANSEPVLPTSETRRTYLREYTNIQREREQHADITSVSGCVESDKGCRCFDRVGKEIPDLSLADCRGVLAAGPH